MPKISLKVNFSRQSWLSPHPWPPAQKKLTEQRLRNEKIWFFLTAPSLQRWAEVVSVGEHLSFDAVKVNKRERFLPKVPNKE